MPSSAASPSRPPPRRLVLRDARRALRFARHQRLAAARSPSLALVFGGLILLTRVWFGFLGHLNRHHGFPVKRVVLVVAIWALPLLLAPPLFSRDVYTYAAQGEMVSHHINPYSYGPERARRHAVQHRWPTPCGRGPSRPTGRPSCRRTACSTRPRATRSCADLVLLRLLEVAGIALMVAATPTLARSLKRDPAHAVLLGAGSPLVLLSLVAGAHNDALMVGLLMAGLAVAKRFGTVPGVILCALAAGVKSPAALGVLFLGWVWAGPGASTRRRIGHTVGAGLIALATMEVMALVSGTGWGWVRTTTTADASFTGVTPVNVWRGRSPSSATCCRCPVSTMDVRPVFSVLGLLIAVYVGYRLLLRSPEDGVGPLPRPDAAGPGSARADRVVLVRDLGRRRAGARGGRPPPHRAHRHQHVLGLRRA